MPYPLFHPARQEDLPGLLSADTFSREFPEEGEHLELKRGASPSRIHETAVAFSNTDGGVCLFGVAPDGTVVGVQHAGERIKEIHQALRDVTNPGRYDVRTLVVGDVNVLVLSVARRVEGFAQTPGGAVLARRGASNVPLRGDELSRFLARRTFERFEATPTSVALDSADPALTHALAAAFGWPLDSALDERLAEGGFATTDASRPVLTVAGALFLTPDPAAIVGRAFIDVRRYATGEPDPNKTWQLRGPAGAQVEEATRTILDELGTVSAIVGAQRVDMPRVPPRAIREVVANAVAHRSYEHAGSAIRVELHPTHVTVTSPGGLPEPVTVDNLRYQQAARNDRVLGALRRQGLAEDLGKGIDRVQDDMAAEILERPEFDDDGSFFTVTLKLGGAVTPRERAWVRGLVQDGRLDARAAIIVLEVARGGSITNGDVRGLLRVDSVEARALLQALVSEGVLIRLGQRGGSTYHLAPDLGVPARIRHTDDELDRIALTLAADGEVTNSSLRARTGLDRPAALKVLQRLVDRGDLIRLGERRGARYRKPD